MFPEDDEEGVGGFGDEDDVEEAVDVTIQMKARDPTTSTVLRDGSYYYGYCDLNIDSAEPTATHIHDSSTVVVCSIMHVVQSLSYLLYGYSYCTACNDKKSILVLVRVHMDLSQLQSVIAQIGNFGDSLHVITRLVGTTSESFIKPNPNR